MKKYILGLIAIVFAVAFSAFTTVPNKQTMSDLHWYKVSYEFNVNGQIEPDEANYLGFGVPNSTIMVPCESGEGYDCIRGFDEQLPLINPETGSGDVAPITTDTQPD